MFDRFKIFCCWVHSVAITTMFWSRGNNGHTKRSADEWILTICTMLHGIIIVKKVIHGNASHIYVCIDSPNIPACCMCTDYGAVTHLHSIHCRYLVSHFINISFTDLIIKRKRVAGSACLSFNGSDYNSFEMRMRLSVNVLCVWLTAHLFLAFSCFFFD